jgi:hypothetical protein
MIDQQKLNKYDIWIVRLFYPVLFPVRFLVVLPARKLYYRWVIRRYPARLRKAKKIAIDRNRKTGEKQFGIKIGLYIEVWSRDEINIQNRHFGKKLGKKFDYRKFAVFTCENGRIV